MSLSRKDQRDKRHIRLRKKISGTAEIPRMAVFTSEKHLYVQFIDDVKGKTLASTSTIQKDVKDESAAGNMAGATVVGRIAAEKAKAVGIEKVVFDRGGFSYQGRVQAIADAAREAGLKF
ncbi:50S ribosomal protein L18 [bacterium F16]|nr:50S ribosomal protein L18 [bacterium F16]